MNSFLKFVSTLGKKVFLQVLISNKLETFLIDLMLEFSEDKLEARGGNWVVFLLLQKIVFEELSYSCNTISTNI